GAAGFAPAAFPLFAGTCGPFQRPAVLDTAPRLCYTSRVRPAPKRFSDIRASRSGRIAQLVEQLTLNQRVQGSNPCAPTKFLRDLDRFRGPSGATVYRRFTDFVLHFVFQTPPSRCLRELHGHPSSADLAPRPRC